MNTWELEEHGGNVIENLVVQTYWEDQNPKDNFKTFHSPSSHTHKLDPPMLSHLSGYMKCLFLKWFVTLSGLGFRYPFLGKWVFIWTCINNNNLKP